MIDETKNPLGLQNVEGLGVGWDAIHQSNVELLAPMERLWFNETLKLECKAGVVEVKVPLQVPSFTVSGVPSASPAAQLIYVSDEAGGAVVAFSDGTNWRRVTDRAVVS